MRAAVRAAVRAAAKVATMATPKAAVPLVEAAMTAAAVLRLRTMLRRLMDAVVELHAVVVRGVAVGVAADATEVVVAAWREAREPLPAALGCAAAALTARPTRLAPKPTLRAPQASIPWLRESTVRRVCCDPT